LALGPHTERNENIVVAENLFVVVIIVVVILDEGYIQRKQDARHVDLFAFLDAFFGFRRHVSIPEFFVEAQITLYPEHQVSEFLSRDHTFAMTVLLLPGFLKGSEVLIS